VRSSFREYDPEASWTGFRAAVSLHAHTHHSREVLEHLPRYLARVPVVASCLERHKQSLERRGYAVDFSKGWWHPPVTPREVFESEARQIEQRFGLAPLVSITDHDNLTACRELGSLYLRSRAPLSFEWTVPYAEGYFHLGVHNLPPDSADAWFGRLAALTASPDTEPLAALLADLHADPEILIVFNHPCWDLANVGEARHTALVTRFLADCGSYIHAVELNGYRSRAENRRARALSLESGHPLISGGDRHGCAPNALLNLTAAQSFAEFVAEVRDGLSQVVMMPEYRQPILTRTLAAAADVLRRYPSFPVGRQHWTERVTCDSDGNLRPLSFHWPDGGPVWVRSSVRAFQIVTSPIVLPVLSAALVRMEPPADLDERAAGA
jgi:hypothetical protein